MSFNPNLYRFRLPIPTEHYEHPVGYKPDAEKLKDGIHIAAMKSGTRFIASDGKEYRVRNLRVVRCAGGLREYDLFAYRVEDRTLCIFHSPVSANPLMFTVAKAKKK